MNGRQNALVWHYYWFFGAGFASLEVRVAMGGVSEGEAKSYNLLGWQIRHPRLHRVAGTAIIRKTLTIFRDLSIMDNVKKAGKVYKNSDFIDAERDNLSLLSRMIISNSTITISEKKVLIVIPDEMHDIFETEKITREIKAAAASYYAGREVLAV